jgi:hypothetical protein
MTIFKSPTEAALAAKVALFAFNRLAPLSQSPHEVELAIKEHTSLAALAKGAVAANLQMCLDDFKVHFPAAIADLEDEPAAALTFFEIIGFVDEVKDHLDGHLRLALSY